MKTNLFRKLEKYKEIINNEIENIYKLSVLKGQMIALVYGSEGYFEPSDTSTRAEAATLVRRIYDLKEAGKIF